MASKKSGRVFGSRDTMLIAIVIVALAVGAIAYAPAPSANKRASASLSKTEAMVRLSQIPIYFEKNQGQTNSQVRFLSRAGDYTVFLTDDSAVLAMEHHPRPKMPTWYSVMGEPQPA